MRAETSRLIALTFLPRARVLKLGPVLQLLHALGELLDCLNCGDDARQRLQHTIARLAFTLCINGEPRKQEAVGGSGSSFVHIKRFHDRDKSGWWVLIGLIPIIGAIWLLIELGFLKGTPGPNRFGSPVAN